MATTTIYWGITNNTLYLSSTATTEAPTSFAADNTENSTSYWPWYNSRTTFTNVAVQNQINFNNTNLSYMFRECNALISLDLSNFNTSNVTSMYGMFHNCNALTSLNISSFDTSNVTNMSYMFGYCSALTSLDLSNFNTSNVTSMSGMFRDCYALISLNLLSFNTSNVAITYLMFYDCSNLKTIYVSDLWNISNVAFSDNMFTNCTVLKGSNGTVYDSNYTDKTYAIIDGTNGQSGYLTFGIKVTPKLVNINGYHYTKPTDPFRIDSARLYIDIDKDGEDYSVNTNAENQEITLLPRTRFDSSNISTTVPYQTWLPDIEWGNWETATINFLVSSSSSGGTETLISSFTITRGVTQEESWNLGTFKYNDYGFGAINLYVENATDSRWQICRAVVNKGAQFSNQLITSDTAELTSFRKQKIVKSYTSSLNFQEDHNNDGIIDTYETSYYYVLNPPAKEGTTINLLYWEYEGVFLRNLAIPTNRQYQTTVDTIDNVSFIVDNQWVLDASNTSYNNRIMISCYSEASSGGSFDPHYFTFPTITYISEENNVLHLKGIHGFNVKTPQDPWVIDRIKKGYVTDNGTNILTTNSDGYWTYTPSSGISIGV